MKIANIRGHQAVLGESQGYQPLPVRYGELPGFMPDGAAAPTIQSEWAFTDEERAHIANGGSIMLTIVGAKQPPVLIHVVKPEDTSPVRDDAANLPPPETPLEAWVEDFNRWRSSGTDNVQELAAFVSMLARIMKGRV